MTSPETFWDLYEPLLAAAASIEVHVHVQCHVIHVGSYWWAIISHRLRHMFMFFITEIFVSVKVDISLIPWSELYVEVYSSISRIF